MIKNKLFPDRQAVLSRALRALFQTQPELRRQLIVRTYTVGEISPAGGLKS